jgi:hypothetical protein
MRNPLAAAVLAVSLLVSTVAQPSLFDQIWSFLSVLWSGASADEGCTADPNGQQCLPVERPTADVGCTGDPNGCQLGKQ